MTIHVALLCSRRRILIASFSTLLFRLVVFLLSACQGQPSRSNTRCCSTHSASVNVLQQTCDCWPRRRATLTLLANRINGNVAVRDKDFFLFLHPYARRTEGNEEMMMKNRVTETLFTPGNYHGTCQCCLIREQATILSPLAFMMHLTFSIADQVCFE